MLGDHVHSHFRQIHIRTDTGRCGDARLPKNLLDHFTGHIMRAFAVSPQIPGNIHEYFIYRIDMNVSFGYVP